MDKNLELYQEEIRAELIRLNEAVETLKSLTETQLQTYVAPKEDVKVSGSVIVNTEKEVSISNIEAVKDYLEQFSQEITTAIGKSVVEPVKELKVTNISDAKVEKVTVSNLSELTQHFNAIVKAFQELPTPQVNVTKQEVVFPKSATQAIPVRLSDGKSFYNAMASALSSAVASYINSNNKAVPVTLEHDGSVPITIKNTTQADIFNELITSVRNNQVEVNFSNTDPDLITRLTITKTNGGDATNTSGQAVFSTSTNTSGEIKAITNRTVEYHPQAELYAAFSAIFTTGISNSFQRLGFYDDNNGLFIGYEGTSFGVTKRSGAVDVTIPQASFNTDTLTGQSGSKYTRNGVPEALDTTKDNIYRIRYGWLGAANIIFETYSPDGEWVIFHRIKHPNTVAVPTIQEPNQPLRLHIKKTTAGATNLSIKTACWAAGVTSDLQRINSTVTDDTLVKPVRAILSAKKPNGDYTNIDATAGDNLKVSVEEIDPNAILNTDLKLGKTVKFASVSVSSSGDNTVIAGVTGLKIKLLSVVLIANGTVNVKWRSNTTDLSGPMPLIANSGFVLPASSAAQGNYLQTATGQSLNLNLSAAVAVSGHISYYEEA